MKNIIPLLLIYSSSFAQISQKDTIISKSKLDSLYLSIPKIIKNPKNKTYVIFENQLNSLFQDLSNLRWNEANRSIQSLFEIQTQEADSTVKSEMLIIEKQKEVIDSLFILIKKRKK